LTTGDLWTSNDLRAGSRRRGRAVGASTGHIHRFDSGGGGAAGGVQGVVVNGLALHEQLFLVAQGESAGPAGRPPSLGPGLVAALLVELLLAGRLDTEPGPGPHSDQQGADQQGFDDGPAAPGSGAAAHAALAPVTAAVLDEIAAADPGPPGYWMRSLADGVYETVAARMAEAGLVRIGARRRLVQRRTRLEVGDPLALARLQTDLLHLVNGRRELDAAACALCGLVAVLRLEDTLEAYADPEFGAALREVAKINVPRAEIVLDALEVVLRGAPAAIHRQALLWPR
jgi:hypothetical protein